MTENENTHFEMRRKSQYPINTKQNNNSNTFPMWNMIA